VYVLIEHQSGEDPVMPLRLLYFVVLYRWRQWRAWEQAATPKPRLDHLHPRGGEEGLSSIPMSEVTRILSAIEQGDPHASEQLLPQKLAREKPGQSGHFFAAAAESIAPDSD
jgi:hypothetical protein